MGHHVLFWPLCVLPSCSSSRTPPRAVPRERAPRTVVPRSTLRKDHQGAALLRRSSLASATATATTTIAIVAGAVGGIPRREGAAPKCHCGNITFDLEWEGHFDLAFRADHALCAHAQVGSRIPRAQPDVIAGLLAALAPGLLPEGAPPCQTTWPPRRSTPSPRSWTPISQPESTLDRRLPRHRDARSVARSGPVRQHRRGSPPLSTALRVGGRRPFGALLCSGQGGSPPPGRPRPPPTSELSPR